MKTTKKKVAKLKASPPPLAPPPTPALPHEPEPIWSNSPREFDEDLMRAADGQYSVIEHGGETEALDSSAHVVEFILQRCIPQKHWSDFAAFMPTLYPANAEQSLNVRVEFTGGAAAAVRTMAAIRDMSVERALREVVANDAACWLADSSTNETPDYARIFSLEEEGE